MKRGIILLPRVGIEFSKKDFEYDVYSLVRAFYSRSEVEVQTYYQGNGNDSEFDIFLWLIYERDKISLKIAKQRKKVFNETVFLDYYLSRQDTKNQLKRLLYRALSGITKKDLPWGTLTGIRPTKIPMRMLESNISNPEIANYMREAYYCSDQKTALAIAIANQEAALLEEFDYTKGYSLYIGIPFCPSICLYCSFGSHPIKQYEKQVDAYLAALFKEITFVGEIFADKRLDTIYIGGGTPTTLHAEQIESLLQHVCKCIDIKNVREFTVEAGRPDSITKEKLQAIAKFPVTRISINPQTMNQKTLDVIGRKHSITEIEEAFALARQVGFDNINMDLIVGLPGEGSEEVANTLEKVKRLNPDSLTVHSLSLKRTAQLMLFKEKLQGVFFTNSQPIMDMAAASALEMEMRPYYLYRQKNIAGNFENVGYSRPDKIGLYNILIIEEKQTIMAVGAGAATKLVFDEGKRIERVESVKDVKTYISRVDEMIERKRTGIEKWLK